MSTSEYPPVSDVQIPVTSNTIQTMPAEILIHAGQELYMLYGRMACNYDPNANFNIPELCCYPGLCGDRDIAVVCPQLSSEVFSSIRILHKVKLR